MTGNDASRQPAKTPRPSGASAYRRLLRMAPAELRDRHAGEMEELFEETLLRARDTGAAAAARTWLRAAGDLLAERGRDWLRRRRLRAVPGPGNSRRRAPMLWSDARYAVRSLLRQPSATLLVLALLSLGIAANVTVFGLVNGLFLRPFPFPEADRLVYFNETAPKWDLEEVGINYPDFDQWRKGVHLFEGIALYQTSSFNVSGDGAAERIRGAEVTCDFARVLGIRPAIGRVFTPEEDRPKGPPVVMIGQTLWRQRFGADPNVVGRTLRLDGVPRTIVGVLPAEAAFPDAIELWVPLAGDPGQTYQSYAYNGIGRLRPGVSIEAAARDLIRAHAPVWQDHDREKAVSPFLRPLRDEFVRDFTAVASMLSAAVGLLLIVACANVASLMLARALARRHEMGVRLALGAGRARLLRQLLVEHAILAAAGGVIGLGLGQVALRGIVAALPDELPRWAAFQVDARVIAFAVGVVVVTVILFGWAPALHAVRGDLRAAINDAGARSSGSPRGRRTLRLLVGGEFALAALLLVCGGLLFSAFNRVRQVDPGFRPDHVLAFSLSLPEAVYPKDEQKVAFWDSIVGRLDALPGVESAGVVSCAPLGCHWGNFFEAEGQAPRSGAREDPVVLYRPASAGYFRTMGIHLRSGRVFDDRDGRNRLAQTVIVNETFARAFWPRGTSPVGQRIKLRGKENPWMTVVGVVGDVKHYGLELPMRPGVYVPMPIDPSPTLTVAVRTKVDPHAAVAMVRGAVRGLDPDLPMFQIRTMEEALQRSLSVRVAYSSLAGVFSMLALVLALAGTYGVTSYLVTQRTRELGIRIALGARTPDIVRSVVSRGLVAVGGGVAAGLVVSLAAVKLLSTLLFGVGRDAAVIGGVAFLLLATALLANLIPARRAARVDPVRSLRTE